MDLASIFLKKNKEQGVAIMDFDFDTLKVQAGYGPTSITMRFRCPFIKQPPLPWVTASGLTGWPTLSNLNRFE